MMKNSYQITIPKPCHEDWERMTVVERGRFCDACRKKVFDFTHSSDREIIAALKKDNLCGRFRESQLDRDLQEPKTKSPLWIAAATGIIGFLGLGSHVSRAQEKPAVARLIGQPLEEIEQARPVNPEIKGDTLLTRTISGTVTDHSGPLPAAQITNLRSKDTAFTDVDGRFSIQAQTGDVLAISFIGAETINETVTQAAMLNFRMETELMLTGMVGEVVFVKQSFFSRLFHKIGNVFH